MIIKQLSDLHLEHSYPGEYFNPGSGQILILAGDILCVRHFKTKGFLKDIYTKFLEDCSSNFEEVIYVLGNHEFYGYNYEGTYKKLKEHLPDNFHLLENETVKIDNINFIGATLWTNFFNENPFEMLDAKGYMSDYNTIRITPNYRKLNPDDTLNFHKTSIDYLKTKLNDLINERVFVISHHAPSLQCITPKFKTEKCNGSFCSDLDEIILNNPQIKNWAFGHVHSQHDFYIGECRLTGNPRGYHQEKTNFNSNFEIIIN